jgi:rhodanese-related sulfurtransferase
MKKKKIQNLLFFVGIAGILFFQTGLANRFSKIYISPADTIKVMESGKGTLVDVREKDEVDAGMIQGAKWIPLSGINENSAETKTELAKIDRNQEVLLYCRSGNRSGKAATILEKQGFKVRNAGSYQSLVDAGMKSTK